MRSQTETLSVRLSSRYVEPRPARVCIMRKDWRDNNEARNSLRPLEAMGMACAWPPHLVVEHGLPLEGLTWQGLRADKRPGTREDLGGRGEPWYKR
jgi:hypothetical protein